MLSQGQGYGERSYGTGGSMQSGYGLGSSGYEQGQMGPSHGQHSPFEFDPDYSEWRQAQMRTLDDDYRAYRQERQKKFSDDFETWRKGRDRSGDKSKQGGSSGSSAKSTT
jgi:hypothetical protein